MPTASQRTLLNYAGIAILMLGMITGELIYWRSLHTADPTSDRDILLTPESSRVYERAVETNMGTFGLIMVQFSQAIGKLKEPKPLAITICLGSALLAGGSFLMASRQPRD
ncbi:MAG TPA: hypothetical protein VGM54_11340 [Chthoniobacter sp.]|jgi:hypothetical protein